MTIGAGRNGSPAAVAAAGHLPTGCVVDVCWSGLGEEQAELREGSATPELNELAKGYFRMFGCYNPANQPPGVPWLRE
jgi:hypothetical protein